jgi:hypothetical protein
MELLKIIGGLVFWIGVSGFLWTLPLVLLREDYEDEDKQLRSLVLKMIFIFNYCAIALRLNFNTSKEVEFLLMCGIPAALAGAITAISWITFKFLTRNEERKRRDEDHFDGEF